MRAGLVAVAALALASSPATAQRMTASACCARPAVHTSASAPTLGAPQRASRIPSAERHVLVGAAVGVILGVSVFLALAETDDSGMTVAGAMYAVVGGGLGGAAAGFLVYIARRAATGPSRAATPP